jgi:hypothetical protein
MEKIKHVPGTKITNHEQLEVAKRAKKVLSAKLRTQQFDDGEDLASVELQLHKTMKDISMWERENNAQAPQE